MLPSLLREGFGVGYEHRELPQAVLSLLARRRAHPPLPLPCREGSLVWRKS